jgi:ribosomal protein S18 acetylase RimI-like enzyme
MTAVLHLIFQYASAQDRELRVRNALRLLQLGELDPAGVLVARANGRIVSALVCLPVPGASSLFWPPQTVAGADAVTVEDALVRHARTWLRSRGAKLGQAMLLPELVPLGTALLRNGFQHLTQLWYLRHGLDLSADFLGPAERLRFRTYPEETERFHETLLHTYEGTLDCPEVNGIRDLSEIMAGHQAQGVYDPQRWWLALKADRPVGVLLLCAVPDLESWDVAYVGVVPEARRRGYGRELMRKALFEARAAEAGQLMLSVDARNRPAWDLYQQLGFEPFDQREVFLAVWG